MKATALGLLLFGAAPMLVRAWYLVDTRPESDQSLRWLVGACICLALAAGILR